MLHDIMPGTEDILKKECITAYVGINPTADSLHIGIVAVRRKRPGDTQRHAAIVGVGIVIDDLSTADLLALAV